jgi:mannose-6-phosphate isomerase-like protein (cupin superfamily)
MAGYAVKRIDELEAAYGGGYKRARAELGAEAFGFQILDFPPNEDRYPEHDHSFDGQEEVYVVMRGSGAIDIAGERFELNPEVLVRVGAGVMRNIFSGDEGLRLAAIGGVPGQAYVPSENSKLGAGEPVVPGAR